MANRASTADKLRAAEARREASATAGFGDPQFARSAAPDGLQLRHMMPRGLTVARQVAFPAQLRAKLETREGKEWYHLSGHASVVDTAYEMWDWFGPYDEIVEAGSFDVTLGNEPDVMFLVNHRGLGMARTTAKTLELSTDPDLASDAWVNPKRSDVMDLVHSIDDETITEMSFAFRIADNGAWWSDDFMTFKITEVDLDRGDVSAVNYGANPYTDIAARQQEIMRDVARLPDGAQRAVLADIGRRFRTVQDAALRLAEVQPAPLVDVAAVRAAYERGKEPPAEQEAATIKPATGRSISHIRGLLGEEGDF